MDLIVWADVESTGLSPYAPSNDKLLQVACVITDNDLNILDEVGYEAVVYYSEEETKTVFAHANEYVQNMHTNTGLWDRLAVDGKTLETIDSELLSYIKQFQPEPKKAWLGGNSIKLDRDFLGFFLPNTFEHIHYRSVDVTSFAGIIEAKYGYTFKKKATHNAMDDIRESLAELKDYTAKFFV